MSGLLLLLSLIPLKKRDVQRLADHFGLSFEAARKKFTKVDGDEPYRHAAQSRPHFGKICRFFDTENGAAPSTRPARRSAGNIRGAVAAITAS